MPIFFAAFSQRQYCWIASVELDSDEHVQTFHADCTSSVLSTDPFAVSTVAGSRDTVTVSNSSGVGSTLLIICIEAPESTINYLSSALTAETDADPHSILVRRM